MSNLETLLTAWLNDGEVPAGFRPETRIEEYLVAILEGVDDSVTPESRADVLLDAIATKYAGYADGITDLRAKLGLDTVPEFDEATTPQLIALAQDLINGFALGDLAEKGATGVARNTLAILDAYSNLPSGGAELNIAFNSTTAPEDTTKLWVKTAEPTNVTVDYDIDNGVESVQATTTPLEYAASNGMYSAISVGKSIFLLGYGYSDYYITEYNTETGVYTYRYGTGYHMYGNAGVAIGKKIYIVVPTERKIFAYDTETYTMSSALASIPQKNEQLAACAVGNKIYMFGGSYNGTRQNTIYAYDTENNIVATLPVTLPTAASAIGCAAFGTKIYLFGGETSNGVSIDDICVFDTETNAISVLQEDLPTSLFAIGVAPFGTKCYLIGGGSGSAILNTISVFDAQTETISPVSATLPQTVGNAGCAVVGNSAYLFGGWNGSAAEKAVNKFNITFPLDEGDVYIQTDVFKNKFTLVKSPTEVKTGVAAVYVGNASDEAEYAEAYLHDGAAWQPIT